MIKVAMFDMDVLWLSVGEPNAKTEINAGKLVQWKNRRLPDVLTAG